MDIKLRNKKFVNILTTILSAYIMASVLLCSIDLIKNKEVASESYFKTYSFAEVLWDYNNKLINAGFHYDEDSQYGLQYYIKNNNSGEVFSNTDTLKSIEDYVNTETIFYMMFPFHLENNDSYFLYEINSFFINNDLKGYFMVPKAYESKLMQLKDYNSYKEKRKRFFIEMSFLLVCLIVVVFIVVGIRTNKLQFEIVKLLEKPIKKLPIDLRFLLLLSATVLLILHSYNSNFLSEPFSFIELLVLTLGALCITYIFIAIKIEIDSIKSKHFFKEQFGDSLIHRFIHLVRESLVIKGVLLKISLLLFITIMYGAALFGCLNFHFYHKKVYFESQPIWLVIAAVLTGVYFCTTIIYVLRKIRSFNRIFFGTREIVCGNLNYIIEKEEKGSLSDLAYNINSIKEGYKKTLESQVKSERYRTELITNVSHDLKTPLTSIVNYVNLLKKEDLTTDEVRSFTDILEKKTHRLKVLIDDLFEASKMASGSVELAIERIDIVALLNQALAEFDERIAESTLNFKVKASEQKIHANLDGKKIWRVFENLISNILKYSHPNTRVFIDLEEREHKVIIAFKNVSNYELDFDVEEIFERFKRGDKSRNTEGSGLGLTIAKSIVELHGGKLSIELDGDLFKAIIEFDK